MPSLTTFRSPVVSVWQSAVNEVLAQQRANQPQVLGEDPLPPTSDAPIMLQLAAAAEAILSGQPVPPEVLGVPIEDCAKLYLQLILAEARGDTKQVAQLKNEIDFSTCDPLWAKCLIEYEKARIFMGKIPYKRYSNINDFVQPLPQQDAIKIALIADWATGMPVAQHLLEEIAKQKPDILIHLGDIYYSGTSHEVQERFLKICHDTLGAQVQLFTLAGNHDMYSGGQGYYWLLDQIKQPASYFCLRNDHWQLLALDTGLHDYDPLSVISNLTYLDPQELDWHQNKIATAAGRRTIMLSHHQLFSAAGSVGNNAAGQPLAVNSNLHDAFANVLDKIDIWLWGHEHNLIVFDRYAELERGRCIGASAVPTMIEQNPYTPDANLVLPAGESGPPIMNPACRLGDDGTCYNHAWAMLTLTGPSAEIVYYQIQGEDGPSQPMPFRDHLPPV